MNFLLTPRAILGTYLAALAALLAAGFFPPANQPDLGPRAWLMAARGAGVYAAALVLCLAIAREHRAGSWVRFAWRAFALNAAASIVRHTFDTPLWDLAWPGYSGGVEIALIRQTAIVVGLGALFAGTAAMVWAIHRMGIGMSPRVVDVTAICGVFAVLATIFYFREGLAEAQSPSALARELQRLGLILLAASAACGILLYRQSRQMSGGRLSVSMLYLVAYAALRCILVCIALFPALQAAARPVLIPLDFAVPWLFALAAAYRRGLALHGAAQIPKSSPVAPLVEQTFSLS